MKVYIDESGMIGTKSDFRKPFAPDGKLTELDDYTPFLEDDYCFAGVYREGNHYRAQIAGGVYKDGANCKTFDHAWTVMLEMIGIEK